MRWRLIVLAACLLGFAVGMLWPVGVAVPVTGGAGMFNPSVVLDTSQVQSPRDAAAEDYAHEVESQP